MAATAESVPALVGAEAARIGFDERFLTRPLNVDLSGGEKKRNETLQLGVLSPRIAVLDELDSGLDVDALRACARRVEAATDEIGLGVLAITHYSRLLDELRPDVVHILVRGEIRATGGPELAEQLEVTGYAAYVGDEPADGAGPTRSPTRSALVRSAERREQGESGGMVAVDPAHDRAVTCRLLSQSDVAGPPMTHLASPPATAPDTVASADAPRRLAYQPGLDGLRGLAVAGVLAVPRRLQLGERRLPRRVAVLHALRLPHHLAAAHRAVAHGHDRPRRFWARRVRRLLPASLAALAGGRAPRATVPTPPSAATLRGDVLGALLDVANWRFLLRRNSPTPTCSPPLAAAPLLVAWRSRSSSTWSSRCCVRALARRRLSTRALGVVFAALRAGRARRPC